MGKVHTKIMVMGIAMTMETNMINSLELTLVSYAIILGVINFEVPPYMMVPPSNGATYVAIMVIILGKIKTISKRKLERIHQ